MLIAQITDPHITRPGILLDGRIDTIAMLAACIERLLALSPRPDLLLMTGDLVDCGHPEEYRQLRAMLERLPMPLRLLPGNHDARDTLRAAFPGQPWLAGSPYLHYANDLGTLRLVALDTLKPGSGGGELDAARLAWLAATLAAAPAQPTLLAMHHPPFITGIAAMDEIGLSGLEQLAGVLTQHPQVRLIVCGHLHRAIHGTVAGIPVLTCPSSAHQIDLRLGENAPFGYVMEPPGLMLHRWHGNSFVTHQVVIGNYAGPYLY
ncbi:phosphodiesterase [Chitinibacteraceae bacterium HSL-7]